MAWFDVNYQFKKQITIDHTKVSGGANLTNFPVLILTTDANLKTVGNGGSVQNASGFDIIFTDSTETTKLDHEIESYTASTGAIVMWVRIPTLSFSVDTIIYCYYDNATIAVSQENKTGVWDSNFAGVWHFKEDPSGTAPQMKDSTTNVNHGTSIGAMTTAQQVAGKVAGSLSFEGTDDVITAPNVASLKPSGDMTISCWINLTQTASVHAEDMMLFRKGNTVAPWQSYQFFISTAANTLNMGWVNSTSNLYNTVGTTALTTTGVWLHVVYTKSGAAGAIYLNGVNDTASSDVHTGTLFNSDDVLAIGAVGQFSKRLNGLMDEVRLSSVARSVGWSVTDYNNQNSPATFMAVGAAISNGPVTPLGPAGAWVLAWNDEFDNTAGMSGPTNGLIAAKWNGGWYSGPSSPGVGQNLISNPVSGTEIQYYGPAGIVFPGDGAVHLRLQAGVDNAGTYNTRTRESGFLSTAGLMNFNPGSVPVSTSSPDLRPYVVNGPCVLEIRARFPGPNASAGAYWPALWMANAGNYGGTNPNGTQWPGGQTALAEIDMTEFDAIGSLGSGGIFNMHYASSYGGMSSLPTALQSTDISLAYHTYTYQFTTTTLTFWVDGILVGGINPTTAQVSAQWAYPMYLIMNFAAVAGAVYPTTAASTPSDMMIDYVRVWSAAATLGVALAGNSILAGTMTVTGATNALSLYGSNVAASSPATAGKSDTTSGGLEVAAVTTAPVSGNGYVECFALGGTSTVNAALPAPTGKGWTLNSTLLELQRLVAGNWGASVAVSDATASGTVISYTIRFWQRSSGGTYAAIGSIVLSTAQVISAVRVVKSFPATAMPQTDFTVGDQLYIDFFINANGWASDLLSVYVSSSSVAGVVGDLQVDTAGFIPSGSSGVVTSYIPRALSALLVVTSTALANTLIGTGTLAGTVALGTTLAGTLSGNGLLVPALSANETLPTGTLVGVATLSATFVLATSCSAPLVGVATLVGSVQLTTALARSLAGAGTLTSSFQLATALSSTLAGIGVLTPALTAAFTLSGATLPGVAQLSGSLAEGTALSTQLAGAGVLTPALTAAFTMPGVTIPGVATLAGSLAESTALVTQVAGVGILSGTLQASAGVALAMTLTGIGILSGPLSAVETLSGATLAGVGTLAGSLSAAFTLSGATLSGVATLAGGAFQFATALTLSTAGSGVLTGPLSAAMQLASLSIAGVGTLSGPTLSLSTQLAASLVGIGTSSGQFSAALAMTSATMTGVGTLTGIESMSTQLVGALAGTGTLAGTPGMTTALAITLAGNGQLSGVIASGGALSVVMAGAGTVAGGLSAALSLSATASGVGALAGILTARLALTSTLTGAGSSTATIALTVSLPGTLTGTSGLTGTSILATSLFVITPGTGGLSGTITRVTMLTVVFTAVSQCNAALVLGGGQFALCLLAGHSTLVGAFSFPGKSPTATWKTRDLTTTWQTRDLAATWKTRDLEDTWEEEG